jgi:GT2 family glycosyltransferase
MVAPLPSVTIVILNWNGWQDTLACAASCRLLSWPNLRIIIVDNGSTDSSEERLREHITDLDIIQTGENLGFAGGCNVGIRHAMELGADFVWLLNNDAVVEPASLTALTVALQNDTEAACAGSKIYYLDDPQRIWFAGGIWENGWLRLRQRGAGRIDHGEFDAPKRVAALSGCSMLLRSQAIERLGLLNEDYFLYWEDVDWCARAGKAGFTVLFTPSSRVWHKVSAAAAPRSRLQYYYYTRNGLYFCCRYDLLSLPLLLLYTSADVLAGLLKMNTAMFHGYCSAVLDFLCGRRGKQVLP